MTAREALSQFLWKMTDVQRFDVVREVTGIKCQWTNAAHGGGLSAFQVTYRDERSHRDYMKHVLVEFDVDGSMVSGAIKPDGIPSVTHLTAMDLTAVLTMMLESLEARATETV